MLTSPVNKLAMTGEVSIHGRVKPVGGVLAKVEAAFQAGAEKVIIPKENWQAIFEGLQGVEVIPVETVDEVFGHVFGERLTARHEIAADPQELALPAEAPFAAAPVSVLHANPIRQEPARQQVPHVPREGHSPGSIGTPFSG